LSKNQVGGTGSRYKLTRNACRTNGATLDDPVNSARLVKLRYVTDHIAGIKRLRRGKAFQYRDEKDRWVREAATLDRIKSLAIPPAWTRVWICPSKNGHLQATGRDSRGRKQYRYHRRWTQIRDETKYEHMLAFGRALPRIRRRVARDLARKGLPREKVLAAILLLLERTLIRVGSDEYARQNDSFGLTTMRDRHARILGTSMEFEFRGKGGKEHCVRLNDRRLARILGGCQELPGLSLFQYKNADGRVQKIGSGDVNDYLHSISNQDFTAKDFRTWAGTVLAARVLSEFEPFHSQAQAKRNIGRAVKVVAHYLGNTPAICRKCYIHPAIIEAYLHHSLARSFKRQTKSRGRGIWNEIRSYEAKVLSLLATDKSRPNSIEC
jgi:DNA topoisomerase-1